MILNIGCGHDTYGDVRIDISRTHSVANLICDCDTSLPFKDNTFSEIKAQFIFEHLINPNIFLKEAERILELNGKLVLTTDNASYWRYHLPKKFKFGWLHGIESPTQRKDNQHYALYDIFHIRNHVNKTNLDLNLLELTKYEGKIPLFSVERLLCTIFSLISFRHVFMPCVKMIATKKECL